MEMDLPMLDFLQAKNIYTGSVGDFRYRFQPEAETVKVWAYDPYCFEYCREHDGRMLGEAEFSLDADGLAKAGEWLGEKYNAY